MSDQISFQEWYEQFQKLIIVWKELSSDKNWIESHKKELEQHGLKPSELALNIQRDIDVLTKQIMNYDEVEL